jgi:hypothetical protein
MPAALAPDDFAAADALPTLQKPAKTPLLQSALSDVGLHRIL